MSHRLVRCIHRVLTVNRTSLVLPKPTYFCLNGNKLAFLTSQRRPVGCQRSENMIYNIIQKTKTKNKVFLMSNLFEFVVLNRKNQTFILELGTKVLSQ